MRSGKTMGGFLLIRHAYGCEFHIPPAFTITASILKSIHSVGYGFFSRTRYLAGNFVNRFTLQGNFKSYLLGELSNFFIFSFFRS